ncbi:MAG: biotin/lipoyl-binding protein [Candidatus Schekmanbacteria bacterium]|nr:biotin/lipoyl-binding protein [Candidatus Schekmanbacteria bacterium]
MAETRPWARLFAVLLGALCACAAGCAGDDPHSLVLLGTLERDAIQVAAPAFAALVELSVTEGDEVEAGAVLARLDGADMQAALNAEAAARDRALAVLAQVRKGARAEELDRARAAHDAAVATAEGAEIELRRVQGLAQKLIASPSAVDRAETAVREARAQARWRAAALAELREGTRVEEIDAAAAAVAQAEARVAQLQTRLRELELRAPVAGRVEALLYDVGERPPAGAIVATLEPRHPPYAHVFVPEPVAARLRPRQPARVTLDGRPDAFTAHFRFVASRAMFTPYYALTRQERERLVFEAKVELAGEPAMDLPSGIPVRVLVDLSDLAPGPAAAGEPAAGTP